MKFLLLLALASCAGMPEIQNSGVIYQKDMPLKVDGVKMSGGVYVLGRKPSYSIRADLFRSAMVFKITSCHREWIINDPGSNVDFIYEPVQGIEDVSICPLELGGFDIKGQHSWAYVDFLNSETLPAETRCNGRVAQSIGVSVCQSRTSLIQEIRFTEEVEAYGGKTCAVMKSGANKTFTLNISQGKCVYLFKNKAGELHRLTTIGYDETLLRD